MAAKTKCLVTGHSLSLIDIATCRQSTGGCGFVGRRLVKEMIDSGRYDVTVFDLNPPQQSDPLPDDVTFVRGDLTQPEQAANGIKGAGCLDSAAPYHECAPVRCQARVSRGHGGTDV